MNSVLLPVFTHARALERGSPPIVCHKTMVKDRTIPSQNASTIAADQIAQPKPALQGDDIAVEANKSATSVAADKTALPPPALQGNNNAVLNSGSNDSETSPSQPPPEERER